MGLDPPPWSGPGAARRSGAGLRGRGEDSRRGTEARGEWVAGLPHRAPELELHADELERVAARASDTGYWLVFVVLKRFACELDRAPRFPHPLMIVIEGGVQGHRADLGGKQWRWNRSRRPWLWWFGGHIHLIILSQDFNPIVFQLKDVMQEINAVQSHFDISIAFDEHVCLF